MCKGQQSTTTSQTPNPTALAAYNNLVGSAQQIGQTPFIPYSGQQVAPQTPVTTQGISNTAKYANAAQPGIAQAEGLIDQSAGLIGQAPGLIGQSTGLLQGAAQPLTTSQINQYMSPYTQDVVNATEAQFNNQNAQQQNQLVGNAASVGALGGNRIGVAQAQLAGQQQLAEAPVIAGLYNTAYNTGLSTAEQEFQANPMTAAYGLGNNAAGLINAGTGLGNAGMNLGNLAVTGQNAGLQGAAAQIQAGQTQQQTQQAIDTAAYNYYLAQAGYPEQMLNWESGIVSGIGSLMGGTGYTQGPTPSLAGPVAGLGIAALGAFAKDGGRIPELDAGGAAPGVGLTPYGGGNMPYGGGPSYIPSLQITHGRGPPQPPNPPQQQQSAAGSFGGVNPKGIMSGFKGAQNLWGSNSGDWAGGPEDVGGLGEASGGRIPKIYPDDSDYSGIPALASMLPQHDYPQFVRGSESDLEDKVARGALFSGQDFPWKRGGRIPHFDTGGGADDDGVMPPSSGWGSFASSDSFLPPDADRPIQVADASGVMPSASDMTSRAETGTDPVHGAGNISPDAGRSLSYGIYGLNSRSGSARAFENQYGGALGITAAPGTPEFNRQWRDAAAKNPQGFADAQYAYYEKNIFPQSQKALEEYGVPDSIKSDPRVQKYMSDRYVQMGTVGLGGAIAGAGYAQTPEQFIHAMSQADRQNLRSNFRTYLSDNPQNVPGLMNRISMRDSLAGGGDDDGGSSTPLAYSADEGSSGVSTRGLPHVAQSADTRGVASDSSPRGGFLGLHLSDATRQGLIGAGLGMMASGSPYPLQQIGQGGLQGLQAYSQAKTRDLAVQRLGIEAQKAQALIAKEHEETSGLQTTNAINAEKLRRYNQGSTAPVTPIQVQPVPPPTPPSAAAASGPATPSQGQRPSTPAPAPGTPAAPQPTQQPTPQLDPDWDPARLQEVVRRNADLFPETAKIAQDRLKEIMSTGMSRDVNGNVVQIPGYATAKAANEAPGEVQKLAVKEGADRLKEFNTAGQQADANRQTIALERPLINDPNFNSGSGVQFQDAISKLGVKLGLSHPDRATPGEVYDKLRSSSILDQIRGMKGTGPIRVAEMNFIDKMIAGRENTGQSIRDLVEIEDRVNKRMQGVRTLAQNYIAQGHPYLDNNFEMQLAAYVNDPKNALFTDEEQRDPRLIAPPVFKNEAQFKAARLPRGYPFKVQGMDGIGYAQ